MRNALFAGLVSLAASVSVERSPAVPFGAQALKLARPARARVPLPVAQAKDARPALQAVRWFDELSMLEVFYMGDLAHEEGADDAAALEAAIAASGGNVSRFLLPEERVMPEGSEALSALNVCFTVEITDHESGAEMPPGEHRLRVTFTEGYPLSGSLPIFELLHESPDGKLPPGGADAVLAAATNAVQQALAEDAQLAMYIAIGAAKDAMAEGLWKGGNEPTQRGSSPDEASQAAPRELPVESLRGPDAGGAWAVLGPHGQQLHSVLDAWDVQRRGSCSAEEFRRAAQALAALGICSRQPSELELDSMFELLAEGRSRLQTSRLLEPLDAINALVARRLAGIECRTWLELDKWADQSYSWYVAGRQLRSNPSMWRHAASSRGVDPFHADRSDLTLHLFAADEGGWGKDGHVVDLAACALLVVDRNGHGCARLKQLCVSPSKCSDTFDWEFRVVDAADLLAEQRGHLWLAVSAPEDSEWRAALISRGFRAQAVPPGEPDGKWLIKGTPLRERV